MGGNGGTQTAECRVLSAECGVVASRQQRPEADRGRSRRNNIDSK